LNLVLISFHSLVFDLPDTKGTILGCSEEVRVHEVEAHSSKRERVSLNLKYSFEVLKLEDENLSRSIIGVSTNNQTSFVLKRAHSCKLNCRFESSLLNSRLNFLLSLLLTEVVSKTLTFFILVLRLIISNLSKSLILTTSIDSLLEIRTLGNKSEVCASACFLVIVRVPRFARRIKLPNIDVAIQSRRHESRVIFEPRD